MTLDYQTLRENGLEYIRKYSSNEWTDYNSHDPGITILEYLCYVLSDLSLRTTRPIADFLAVKIPHKKEIRFGECRPLELLHDDIDETTPFHYAKDILPCQPLTSTDFQKIIIDTDGVECARVKAGSTPCSVQSGKGNISQIDVKGVNEVVVRFDSEVDAPTKEKIVKKLKKRLAAHRNLCEDFLEIREAVLQDVYLHIVLELGDDSDRDDVLARCECATQQYIAPHIGFYSLAEMQEKGKILAEIFNGPLLKHGFVDDKELEKACRRILVKSEVRSLLQDIPGVVRVKKIILAGQAGFLPENDVEILDLGDEASFFQQKNLECTCWQKGREYISKSTDYPASVKDKIRQLRAQNIGHPKLRHEPNVKVPSGDGTGILDYPSLQHHFPLCYGIGPEGMPEATDDERKAQAKQLKGYLLLFEQFAADYLAQLAHQKELFSMARCDQTYFWQAITDCPGVEDVVGNLEEFKKKLQASAEPETVFLNRRNGFLDHLLARFAESIKPADLYVSSKQLKANLKHLIIAKQAYLKDYAAISSKRGDGLNYLRPLSANNISGLERRVRFILGMDGRDQHELFIRTSETNTFDNKVEYRFYLRGPEEEIYLSSKDHFYSNREMTKTMDDVRMFGQDVKNFLIKHVENDLEGKEFSFVLVDDNEQILAEHPNAYEDENGCHTVIFEVCEYLSKYSTKEPLYIVEHIMLRPEAGNTGTLCPSALETGMPLDPYSFQLSAVMSKDSGFYDQRDHIENVILDNTPAHILPLFVWLEAKQMEEFECRYADWAEEYAAQSKKVQKATNALAECVCRSRVS